MIREIRRYSVLPGRMSDMHERMEHMLLPMFQQHGVPAPFAIWDNEGSSEATSPVLTWMLEWESYEQRRETWINFRPFFEKARQEKGEDEFVARTNLSLVEAWPSNEYSFPHGPHFCELAWIAQPEIGTGKGLEFRSICQEELFPSLLRSGAVSIKTSDYVFGPLPQVIVISSWKDHECRMRALQDIANNTSCVRVAETLSGQGNLLSLGSWELFNRAKYLGAWTANL